MVINKPGPDTISRARELSLAGLLGALGLLLPIGFHALGWGGKVFLPMHLPIVVAAFIVRPTMAASLGLIVPLLSAVLTGMPPIAPPLAPLMAVELSVKATAASVLYRKLRFPIWVALPVAIAVDWAVLILAAMVAASFFAITLPPTQYLWAVIGLSLPGTILQLAAVPLAVAGIERRVPRLRREQLRDKG